MQREVMVIGFLFKGGGGGEYSAKSALDRIDLRFSGSGAF